MTCVWCTGRSRAPHTCIPPALCQSSYIVARPAARWRGTIQILEIQVQMLTTKLAASHDAVNDAHKENNRLREQLAAAQFELNEVRGGPGPGLTTATHCTVVLQLVGAHCFPC